MRFSSLLALGLVGTGAVSARAVKKRCATGIPTMQPEPTLMPTPTDEPVPTETSAPPKGGPLDPSYFFPLPFKTGFTTLPEDQIVPQNGDVLRVELSDNALKVKKVMSGVTHDIVPALGDAPPGTLAYQANYPKGSYNPSGTPRGGIGFYTGSPDGFSFEDATEIVFSYAVYFQPGFMFNKGGKLPGPYGGSNEDVSFACSGGRQEDRDKCFDLRLMFRKNGMGEIYAYLPIVDENDVLLELEGSVKDTSYGFSVARGAFTWPEGEWAVAAQRVKLNDVGSANGELELFINGESKILAKNLVIRQYNESVVRGSHFQSFFGGSTVEWASEQDQSAWFSDISASVIA
ncbi:hypothetical protein AURDEDRAFT_115727 [Auricularia subglabra TFB-10046 SS5]|uniref:Polysaccharide lyase 14 domain-containing protein n=1 Tax=Auricularia subglabra (strain TFB-10046 / SS5) TaxID=717982 RepID=J0LJS3_AURST|nr:hypothetical protein AURDEDRAFT_115727 [Auricularia subglabra TFB-10046 SS5]